LWGHGGLGGGAASAGLADPRSPRHHLSQLAQAALAARPPDAHSMTIAGQVMAACGRARAAAAAWRAAADAAPGDADVAAGWFAAAAACLDYASLAPAATRLARLDLGEGRAWWPAAATALQAVAGAAASPLGRSGLLKLAAAMLARLEAGAEGPLTEQQRLLVDRVGALAAGEADGAAPAAPPPTPPVDAPTTLSDDDPVKPAAIAAAACRRGPDPAAPSACLALLPPTPAPDAAPSIELALLSAASHVAASRAAPPGERAARPLLRALAAVSAATLLDPQAPAPRLAAASLAGLLGDGAGCARECDALALKHVLLDTVASHLALPPLLAAGVEGGGAAEGHVGARSQTPLLRSTLAFHATTATEVGSALAAAFEAGSLSVALDLALFADRLDRSRAGAAADAEAGAAAVEAAAPAGARAAAAAAAGAAEGGSPWLAPEAALEFNDDLSVRPSWLAPPAGDLMASAAAWWEEEEEAGGDCWWARHAAAAGDTPAAVAWRANAMGAIVRRALLPGLVSAALAGEPGAADRMDASAAAWAATCAPDEPEGCPTLSRVALDAQSALWRAAVQVVAARTNAGDAAGAAAALAEAGRCFVDAAHTCAAALAARDGPLLTRGSWGAALALARAAGVAAACAGDWIGGCGARDTFLLRTAACAFAQALQTAADVLVATAPVDVAAAAFLAASLADDDPILHSWVTDAGLDVGARVAGVLEGQRAAVASVVAAAKAASAAAGRVVRAASPGGQ